MTESSRDAGRNLEYAESDPEISAAVDAAQVAAGKFCDMVIRLAERAGYGIMAISISRELRFGEQVYCAGASRSSADPRLTPALPGEAAALRKMADEFDAIFAKSGRVQGLGYMMELDPDDPKHLAEGPHE